MYCKMCGSQIDPRTTRCTNCGNVIAYYEYQPQYVCSLSIISFVLSIVGFFMAILFPISLVSVILGHISKNKINESKNLSGEGLSVAALIIGYLGLSLGIMFWVLTLFGAILETV